MRLMATLVTFICLIAFWTGNSAAEKPVERKLVLVTSSTNKISPLTLKEVRKLFLGVPQTKNGIRLEPLQNISDSLLYEVFLQKITFMSARRYERQLMSHIFQLGGYRPRRYVDTNKLINALHKKRGSVTYMWAENAREIPNIQVIQQLWQGSVE